MLRKIDCVMIRVDDVDVSAAYYAKVFGLRLKWSGDGAVGLVFAESDAEIVLHCETTIPSSVEVHYKVDDVVVAVAHYAAQGCQILLAPFGPFKGKSKERSPWASTGRKPFLPPSLLVELLRLSKRALSSVAKSLAFQTERPTPSHLVRLNHADRVIEPPPRTPWRSGRVRWGSERQASRPASVNTVKW
jgi:lactoylglutathione lyase